MSKKLPFVKSDIPRDLRTFLDRVRELVSGSGSDRLISLDDLTSAGLAGSNSSGGLLPPPQPFLAIPPAPTNVTATAAIRNIIVEWDGSAYPGHAYAEVWGGSTNLLNAAVLVGMSPGGIFVDETGPSTTRFYWVRFVNTNDVKGPYNATSGTSATTGPEVAYLLDQLAGEITSSELNASLNSRINLIDGPATTIGTIPNQLAFLQGQVDAITSYPDYNAATTYAADDIVKYEGGIYKALSATTGNLPTNATFWLKIGDYSSIADVVAAHTAELVVLADDIGAEVTARETLATQMRGGYTGTDLASVTTGLIFSERTARSTADAGLATFISSVSATAASKNRIFRQPTAPSSPQVNDIWVDTKVSYSETYFEQDFSKVKNKQFQWDGFSWLNITDVDIEDNYALVVREQTARATADEAIAQDILTLNAGVNANDVAIRAALQVESTTRANADGALSSLITTLDSQVNNATTGLPATRASLLNDYSTTATVNGAIAQSTTILKAYTNTTASRTFRQNNAPTRRGVDGPVDIALQVGDVWVDIDDKNKIYQWDGSAWIYSPDGSIVESITNLGATLTNDYLTQTDTENAIAQSGTFLRAYADIQSKVFRQADPPTKRGVDPETAANVSLETGDVWYDTNDFNKLYLWSGTAWVYSPDGVITDAVTAVDARVTTVQTTQIGYCTIGGIASDNTNKAACEAAGGTWNVGIPLATAVNQVSISDGADSATLETRATAQKTLNDGLKAQYTIKLDVNGNVAGYGVFADSTGSSEFIANVNRFAVTTPQSSIQVRTNSTTYVVGAIARIVGADDRTLVCKIGGTTGSSTPVIGGIGTMVIDGTVRWQVASRVPFAVQAVPTQINGQNVPAGVYIDAAYVLNATIQNAQIADLAVDDQKIASLSVGKLTAGSIKVDDFIQSTGYIAGTQGWRINGNGFAEFGAAAIRGTLTAAQIDARGLSIRDTAGNIILNAGTGNFTGNVAGTAASTVVSTANDAAAAASTAQGTANTAVSAASAAQSTANTAVSAASTAQGTANTAVSAASEAQSTANTAVSAASEAQSTADNAQDDADAAILAADDALGQLTDIASDNILSQVEKPRVISDYDVIIAEQAGIEAQATAYSITTAKTAYTTAITALTTYLATLTSPVPWDDLTGNTTIVGTTFKAEFEDVYVKRQALLDAIAAAARTLANNAQGTANTAVSAASTAQSTADTAVSAASTAQSTADTAVSAASAAQSTANAAAAAVATKMSTDARNVLSGTGGIALGSLDWDTSGNRISGFGVGLTQAGFAAFNSAGTPTFTLSAADGSANFAGTLNVASAASGARMEIKNNVIKVFDASGVLRVQIGDLTV